MSRQSFFEKVWTLTLQVPAGRVATYGQIATLSGSPRAARQVVRILHTSSGSEKLPWYRVINREGKISLKRGAGYEEQMLLLLKEGIECLLNGDVDTGKAILRDYINATIGFDALGTATAKSPKSLMRMFGPKGNPQARNIFEIIAHLQKQEGFRFKVGTVR